MRLAAAVTLVLILSGCGYDGRYRYACQDPDMWADPTCNPPICLADSTCWYDLVPEGVQYDVNEQKEPTR